MRPRGATHRWTTLLGLIALVAAACGGDGDSNDSAGASGGDCGPDGPRYTPEEVAETTSDHDVTPVYAVPKCFEEPLTIGFVNPGRSEPFFRSWSDAMNAAADFYGVEFLEDDVDLDDSQVPNAINSMVLREPAVIGVLSLVANLPELAEREGFELLPLDVPIPDYPHFFGIQNTEVGQIAGELLGTEAAALLETEWRGRNLTLVELTDDACVTCLERTGGAVEEFRRHVEVADDDIVKVSIQSLTENVRNEMRDVLTAHPGDVFALIPINDQGADGAWQAVQAAGLTDDAIIVSLGADEQGQELIRRDTTGHVLGAVDFNPWAEGWNWVEAAIALALGEEFEPYEAGRVITNENVDEIYPPSD